MIDGPFPEAKEVSPLADELRCVSLRVGNQPVYNLGDVVAGTERSMCRWDAQLSVFPAVFQSLSAAP